MKTAPLLSIGIIFKNEARCLERCMRSLQPLRDAIPCELIMADTGADDGSREIAERYADEVFDFPWCDDFAAARNAVMDRCTGKWYFSIDCDEWLDEDISELTAFLQGGKKADFGYVALRDYTTLDLDASGIYSSFFALRLVRRATGQRYEGAIHETWFYWEPVVRLSHTLLHHDGYLYTSLEQKKKKDARNMKLLRRELEKNPDDLRTLIHCMDSSGGSPDQILYIRRAMKLVQAGHGEERYGGVILRNAVRAAKACELPELEEWVEFAHRNYSDSVFVKVDLNHTALLAAYEAKQWEKAIQYGEAYRKGLHLMRTARLPQSVEEELQTGVLLFQNENAEHTLLVGLADVYCQNKQSRQALKILAELNGEALDAKQVRNYVVTLCHLHAQSFEDVAPVLAAFYEQIGQKEPNRKKQQMRLAAFDDIAAAAFTKSYQKEEAEQECFYRPAYTAFRTLADMCEAGRGAELMMTIDPAAMGAVLEKVENWEAFPIEALEYALREGVAFPPAEKQLAHEVLDGLAAKLTGGQNFARQTVLASPESPEYSSLQDLFWAQALAMAALRSFDWSLGADDIPASRFACPEKKEDEDERPKCTAEDGLALIRRFAQIESAVLPLPYTPQALAEENAALLPPMHRWGLFCSRALDALDSGKPQEYLALLRKGLAVCPGQKVIVQFLLDRFQEDTRPQASPELLALAQRVRTILAAYDPNDPAVAALKASPAYQQVAWLIEEANAGGLPS